MKRILQCAVFGALVCMMGNGDADGRGFGGFRAGGLGGGGFGRGAFGGGGFSSFRGGSVGSFGGADRNLGYSGLRSADNFSSMGSSFGGGAYDRSFTDNRGGSVNIAGDRGFASGPWAVLLPAAVVTLLRPALVAEPIRATSKVGSPSVHTDE